VETRKLIVIPADISGYTRCMLESRTAALHGQIVIKACGAGDADGSGGITINEIIAAVNNALNSCVG